MKHAREQGYFLILSVIFIMVIGVMGVIVAGNYSNRARISSTQQFGLQAFYIAESGLEVAARLLVGSNLVSGQSQTCASLTGSSLVTNSAMLSGTFTATAVGGDLYSATTTLSGAITATSNSLVVASSSGLAPHGRVRIDSEAIDYATLSGTTLSGLNRGAAGTTAAAHSSGASVTESVCLVNVEAGIPSLAAAQYQRQLEMAVEVLSGSELWAVGARHGNQFTIVRWNTPTANAWNDVSPGADSTNRQDLTAVAFSSNTNGWAVGLQKGTNYTFVRWNGSLPWVAAPKAVPCTSISTQDLNGVAVISTTEAWAVGGRYPNTCSGTNYRYDILKWNGSTWTTLTPPLIPLDSSSNQNLNAISMLDSNRDGVAESGFAVGDAGVILRYNGTTWATSASGVANNLLGVYVVSASEAWAVGASGRILKWNGSSWSTFSSPTSTTLNAISMVDSNNDGVADAGWAVGNSGVVIYYNGSSWSTQVSGVSSVLNSVAAISSTSAFAVGNAATLIQYNGTSWASQTAAVSSVAYTGIGLVKGGATITGIEVGSWQQNFN